MIKDYVDTEELKRLLSSLLVVLGAIVITALFASIVVPGLRNANRPETPTPVSPVVGQPGWLDPTEFPPVRGRVIPPVDPATLIQSSPELLARGKELYDKNCTACHGENGHGDGTASATMNPRPRNFSSPNGWTNGYDLPAIFETLKEGVPGTSMAPFDYLPKADRMALAHYVQTLGAFPHGTGSPEALEALSKELAAPGEKTPNKIPVSMAMSKLEEEFVSPPRLTIDPEDHSPGAELARRVIVDPSRAAQTLAGSSSWSTGARELAASILPDAPRNGFSVATATLSRSDWQALHAELLGLAFSKTPPRETPQARR